MRLLIFFLISLLPSCSIKYNYKKFFKESRLRFEYSITGDASTLKIEEKSIVRDLYWGGSKVNLIDTFQYGLYFLKIYDLKSNQLIYSRGYCNLFSEWQTTADADTNEKTFSDCILFPEPRKDFKICIEKRDSQNRFHKVFEKDFEPESIANSILQEGVSARDIHKSGNFENNVDIVFFAEGYTQNEQDKFFRDVERFKNYLFGWEPFLNYKDKINILAVFAPSPQTGVDIPSTGLEVETLADAHFGTFGIDRYLTLPDIGKVYKYLNAVPVDQVCVLVNSSKYGGGGIYNYYNIFTSDDYHAELLFLHEFGHGFASLADEYFNSEVAYEDFGDLNTEPYQPNITTLVDFERKWMSMVPDTVPIPTPDTSLYDNAVGVFEGANYVAEGFYRPYRNCAMQSSAMRNFCPVCERSIEKMILFITE
ncbi:MAG: peptidase M64 [Bacteroidales bacterium]|nr:peptidase M64 [Bacteroidales bacterium]MBN2819974.1 peptidase M64 [Bacteroidales bacterium]